MHRLLTNEFANCSSMDDSINNHTTSQSLQQTEVQQYKELQQQTNFNNKTVLEPTDAIIQSNQNENNENSVQFRNLHEQQVHMIYSSDEEGILMDQNTVVKDEKANLSSDESSDFRGFDDFTSSDIIASNQEDFNISRNHLKRHTQADISESEDSNEAEQAGGEDPEEIVVNKDGKVVYRTIRQITPKKSEAYKRESYTPNKRKKDYGNEELYSGFSSTQLKTPPDQIVEVNSDSTTISLKQKRQQINSKFQLNLCQQNLKNNNNANKCSTESTSEFPVSSPSNPQQPRGGKYPARPPLLKNTLPADSFERQLAIITSCNPQMTLAEKIQSWDCEDEISDLEDVRKFDEEFKRLEKEKKKIIKQKELCGRLKKSELKSYDYSTFRQMIIDNINEQKTKKYSTVGKGVAGGSGMTGMKCAESSGSESSKSVVHIDDRPSTSAVAQQLLQQRRSKPQLYFESGELKKRVVKNIPKRNQNSTTPPQTSSSDNEIDCFKKSTNNSSPRQIHIHEKMICPSSSEEAISQDIPTEKQLRANNKLVQNESKNKNLRTQAPTKLNVKKKFLTNSRIITHEEVESFFRPHRLNKERDKFCLVPVNEAEDHSTSIIQMRLDCSEKSTTGDSIEKKQDFFKTPIIPQKYLPYSPLLSAENQKPTNTFLSSPNKITNEDENKLLIKDDFNDKVSQEETINKSTFNDLDGVYHQQHEFCNYLGLTGMSTATAMANAVAELAQCNLARRSMRVFRQQQQERRDKTAKEERLLKSLKSKQLKESRKRNKEGRDILSVTATEQTTVLKSDEGYQVTSQSEVSETATHFRQSERKTRNNSTTKSNNSIESLKKELQIKIHSPVAAKNTEESKSVQSEKEISKPVRKLLMRQSKQPKSEKFPPDAKENREHIVIKNNENEKTENVEEMSVKIKEDKTINLHSPALSIGNSPQKCARNTAQNPSVKGATVSLANRANSVEKSCATPIEDSKAEVKLNEHSKILEIGLINSGTHLISTEADIIQKKIQMALEESRKTKPSIFIVQSLESEKEPINTNINSIITQKNENSTAPQDIQSHKELSNEKEETTQEISPKFEKNEKRRNRKVFKQNKSRKRQLRRRKIIVIKTLKPNLKKSYRRFAENNRKLRSSPRINENKNENSMVKKSDNYKQQSLLNKTSTSKETKSYRNVHTETKDLETYLHQKNGQAKTQLMAKASALLDRSRRMSLRNNCNLVNNKTNFTPKTRKSKLNLRATETPNSKPKLIESEQIKNRTLSKIKHISPSKQQVLRQTLITTTSTKHSCLENDNVVVSSTTNTFEERPAHESLIVNSPNTSIPLNSAVSYPIAAASPIQTKDQHTQCKLNARVHYLNTPPLPLQTMHNPLKPENGSVLYIYHELDILIVIQESVVSFWKSYKLINMFITQTKFTTCSHQTLQQTDTLFTKQNLMENCCFNNLKQSASSSNDCCDWVQLGELDRLNQDFEISVPYANRICLHNSTPIYLEMRAQNMPKNQRDCNLLSMYVNIYFYHDEEMIAKRNSIQLDSIQSDIKSVNYTTLKDSRYFIVTWPQENLLGKTRSGLCKYSLTPQLDTLASIREFKSMRHTIRYLECMSDDKLIGFGETQVTIWDYRSGDVLMNFNLEILMGKNLGSIYFPSQDIEQNNMLILHQFRDFENNSQPELITIACTVTHTQPSYKVLQQTHLPLPAFKTIKSAIKTGDHFVITGQDDDDIWISLTNPRLMTVIPRLQDTKRFYGREKSQLIELTEKTLNVNSLTNHILQLAAV